MGFVHCPPEFKPSTHSWRSSDCWKQPGGKGIVAFQGGIPNTFPSLSAKDFGWYFILDNRPTFTVMLLPQKFLNIFRYLLSFTVCYHLAPSPNWLLSSTIWGPGSEFFHLPLRAQVKTVSHTYRPHMCLNKSKWRERGRLVSDMNQSQLLLIRVRWRLVTEFIFYFRTVQQLLKRGIQHGKETERERERECSVSVKV